MQDEADPQRLKAFLKFVESNPNDDLSRFGLGLEHMKASQFEEAAAQFKEVVRINPSYSAAWKNLAVSLEKLGRVPEAIKTCGEGMVIADKNGDLQTVKEIQNVLRRLKSGEASSITTHLKTLPPLAIARVLVPAELETKKRHVEKARKLFSEDRFDEALEAFKNALAMDAHDAELYNAIALTYTKKNLYEDAFPYAKRYAEMRPSEILAYTSLSMIYQQLGFINEAEEEANQARILSWKEDLASKNKKE